MMSEISHDASVSTPQSVATTNPLPDSTPNQTPPPMASTDSSEQVSETKQCEQFDNEEGNMWNWIKSASNSHFVQKVMKKTKTGVDRVIETLDPGMTPYLREGGEINIVVTSAKEVKWTAIRDAFQKVFGAATVHGVDSQPNIASQPVGCLAGFKGAQERIRNIRNSLQVETDQVVVSVENFVVEHLPEQWFDVACLLIDDPVNNIELKTFTMAIPVDNEIIQDMQTSTPDDYDLRWSGLSVTVGEAIHKKCSWIKPCDWHDELTGTSRRDIILSAAIILAQMYQLRLPPKSVTQDV